MAALLARCASPALASPSGRGTSASSFVSASPSVVVAARGGIASGSSSSSSLGGYSLSPAARHAERQFFARGRSPRDPILAPMVSMGAEEMTDLNTYLLRSRVVFVGSRITDETALRVVAALLSMEILDDKKPITMYINSAGGSPYSAVGIVDTMRTLRPQIRTVAFGQAATTAALLLAAGAPGQRFAMPSARIMLHQPIGGAAGSADEVNITATELHRTSRLINCFLAEFTGKTEEEVEVESDRPSWMSPAQAVEFGIIDRVLPPTGGGVVLDSRAMAAAAAAAAAVEFEQMKLAKEDGSKEGDIDV